MKRPPATPQKHPPGLRPLPPVPRHGIHLLDHLADTLNLSRRAAKKLLDDRVVFVNGRRIWMARHKLQTRDEVAILPTAPTTPQKTNAPPPPIRILLDTPAFLVADKPPNLLTTGEKSLETRLRAQLNHPALRAVHRLDKDTTGCVLFAKNEPTRQALIAQFEAGHVHKLYHALIAGHLPQPQMTITTPIDHLPALTRLRQVSTQNKPPRSAHVTITIETGRTHQIRIHLHQLGAPVLGDRQYFSARHPHFTAVPRQMLHATQLRFTHPDTRQPVTATSPLPRDFRDWMRHLNLT
ncbi:MAG: RluA family pseudouridine synthase [Kiritimatiellia bacterium]|jgi:23S rRNA pseudouridine1911/1915/1917 synthase|nr:RluA family pseudouridine synthase [Lentisphaerota bacterium]